MRRSALLALLVPVLAAWPAGAVACGACLCETASGFFFPAYGPLPTNGRVLVFSPGLAPEAITLQRHADEVALPFTLVEGPLADAWWIVPDAPLTPDAQVRIRAGELTTVLEVDAGADTAPPALTELFGAEPPGGYCDAGRAASIGYLPASEAPLLMHLTVETTGGTRERVLHANGSTTGAVVIGALDGDCLGLGELDTDDQTVRVRARLFDAAGNASGTSDALAVSLHPVVVGTCPDPYPGFIPSCSVSPSGPMLLLASLLALRRRRRS